MILVKQEEIHQIHRLMNKISKILINKVINNKVTINNKMTINIKVTINKVRINKVEINKDKMNKVRILRNNTKKVAVQLKRCSMMQKYKELQLWQQVQEQLNRSKDKLETKSMMLNKKHRMLQIEYQNKLMMLKNQHKMLYPIRVPKPKNKVNLFFKKASKQLCKRKTNFNIKHRK